MSVRKQSDSDISAGAVRTVAMIVLLLQVALIAIMVVNFSLSDWWAWLVISGAVSSIYFSIMAIKTGNPAWILLDLILPN